jgi:transcriptional regulator with XRE-family HTH domain
MGPLESFRRRRGWTQEQLAKELGYRSKGYISALENGREVFSLKLALKIERLSEGEVRAADLCAEARELLPAPPAEARP